MKFILGLAVVLVLGFAGIISFGKSQLRTACYKFEAVSGFETKYVEYTYFHYDCLAEQEDGRWISTALMYYPTGDTN